MPLYTLKECCTHSWRLSSPCHSNNLTQMIFVRLIEKYFLKFSIVACIFLLLLFFFNTEQVHFIFFFFFCRTGTFQHFTCPGTRGIFPQTWLNVIESVHMKERLVLYASIRDLFCLNVNWLSVIYSITKSMQQAILRNYNWVMSWKKISVMILCLWQRSGKTV